MPCRTTPPPSASRGARRGRGTPPDLAARRAVRSWPELSPSAVSKRPSGAPVPQRLNPAQRVPPLGRTVEREGDELGAAADVLPWLWAAKSALLLGDPAVGRIVAVVTHQPKVFRRNGTSEE